MFSRRRSSYTWAYSIFKVGLGRTALSFVSHSPGADVHHGTNNTGRSLILRGTRFFSDRTVAHWRVQAYAPGRIRNIILSYLLKKPPSCRRPPPSPHRKGISSRVADGGQSRDSRPYLSDLYSLTLFRPQFRTTHVTVPRRERKRKKEIKKKNKIYIIL